jgi:hypothetical protein
MKRRIEGLRFALVWAAGIVFGLGFHNPSAADTWSPPSEVLFRLTSASTITRDSLGYVINSPAVAGVVQTRATGPLHAIWEAFEADTTLYWMAVVDDAARAQTIQDLQALTEIEFAEPNIYFDLDDASSPSDFYFQTDYWPYWPWNDEVAIQSVCGAVLNWTTCQHDGYDCNYPETYRPNNSPVRDQWNTTMMQADLAWLVSQGSDSVRVAILDSGVDWQHPDLGANIWNNPDEDLFGDGTIHQTGDEFSPWEFDSLDLDDLDQDENGLFNDLVGWRYHSWDSEPTLPQHDPNHGVCMIGVDPYGPGTSGYQIPHGTQMASLIGAVHNGFGCVGFAPMSASFRSTSGSPTSQPKGGSMQSVWPT